MTVVTSNKNTFRAGSSFGIPAESVYPIFTASGGTGGYTWSDGGAGGAFTVLNATQAEYQPANKTRIVTVSATAATTGGTGTKTLDVAATFPLNGTWGSEGQLDIETAEQKARGGVTYRREEEEITFGQQIDCLNRRANTEGAALLEFWRFHRKVTPFYFLDTDTGELQKVFFTSPVRWKKTGGDEKDYFVNVRGFDDETILDFEPPTALMVTPANNATISGVSVLLSASVSDNVGVQDVQFMVDGVPYDELLTAPPYQVNLNTTEFLNGKHIITARARDTSGNISDAPARIVTINN